MKPYLPLPQGRLRPAIAEDLDDLVHLLHDADVRRYLCDDIVLPRAQVSGMLDDSLALDAQGLGHWIIEDASRRFTGIAGLMPVSTEAGLAPAMEGGIEPVIALNPTFWGKGLAKDALDALIHYASHSLALSRLVAAVDQPNTRSHLLMRRCEFQVIGKAPGPAHGLTLYERAIEST